MKTIQWGHEHTDVDPAGVELVLKTAYEASFFGVKENIDFSPGICPIADIPDQKASHATVSS